MVLTFVKDPVIKTETPETEVEVEVRQPNQEEAALLLQKQIDDLKKGEAAIREERDRASRERDEAVKRAQERESQLTQVQKDAGQSKYDAITSALAAANAEAETAQRDIEAAIAAGDSKIQAEAYRRLAKAESNIARLEDGKFSIEEEAKRQKEAPVVQQRTAVVDPLDNSGLPDTAKTWLRAHPDYLTNHKKNAKLQSVHWDVLDEGHEPFSPEYYESVEEHLGLKEKPEQNGNERRSIVSAPVSREVPNGQGRRNNGEIKLTVEQRQAAKLAGVTEKVYAEGLVRLNEMKEQGEYRGRP